MRSRFTLITPPDPFEPIYYDQSPETVAVRFRDDIVTAEMQRPGEQRIRLVGGYFSLSGVLGGIGASFALLTLAASLIPKISIHLSTGAVLEAALIGAVTCWANLRTAWLLRARRRTGAYLAIVYFALMLANVGGAASIAPIALGTIGLILTATIWKYLD
ncbi:MAG TPA: hypothetical protein VH277_07400 [Gemmatimonadaceae bacterium]|jgi:hypothetical protein|nr:hypothetical protein [Gemmatimonadaceae bacterium]